MANIIIHVPVSTSTTQRSLNFNRWRKNINRITLQSGNNTEGVGGGTEKLLFGDKYTTLFLYNGLYVHIKLVGSKNKRKSSLEKAYTSER